MSYLTINTSKNSSSPNTWSITKIAHDKLISEAAIPDRDLRKIIAHATLYDRLLDQYYNSERPSSPPPSPPSPSSKLNFETIVEHDEDVQENGMIVLEGVEEEGLELVKVCSYEGDADQFAEIAVKEVEVFDDD